MSLITSTLKIYGATYLTPRRNFYVEDIEDYLADACEYSTIEIDNFQYIKHGLNITIKVDMSQLVLDYSLGDFFRYCSIINSNESQKVYYFIMDKKWLGQSTLQLELAMDTINTFRLGTAYNFDDKTKINRQHKDRYVKLAATTWTEQVYVSGTLSQDGSTYKNSNVLYNGKWIGRTISTAGAVVNTNVGLSSYVLDSDGWLTLTFSGSAALDYYAVVTLTFTISARYVKNIDLASEGVTPILYGENVGQITDESDNNNYYLVYRDSPVVCLCYPENPMSINIPGSSSITYSSLTAGYYYYAMEDKTSGGSYDSLVITTSNDNTYIVGYRPEYWSEDGFVYATRYCVCFYRSGTNVYIKKMVYRNYLGAWYFAYDTDFEECTSITINGNSFDAHVLTTYQTTLSTIYAASTTGFTISGNTYVLDTFSSVVRTDGDLIKIIKLPYAPFDIDEFSNAWTYNSTRNTLQLRDSNLSATLLNELVVTELDNPLAELIMDHTPAITDTRSADYEPKLLHSDYYQPKFVYDSFSFVFALERMNIDDNNNYNIESGTPFIFNFVATNTLNSRFLFHFVQYNTAGTKLDDYDDLLFIARNNEVTILNDSYLEYLKLGYNYEVKTKQRQETGQWLGVGLSLVGAVASFAVGATGNAVGAAAGISLATSAMAQLVSAVNTTAQTEAAQAQKIYQLSHQRASVNGADDVDLLTYYTENKAKLMLYQCSSRMKSVLFDLFFYTGYVDGTMGVPDTTSRTRFNFVSCEPVFTDVKNIPEDMLNDMELKYNAGVTFIHHYNSEWDMEQQYENWETSLF